MSDQSLSSQVRPSDQKVLSIHAWTCVRLMYLLVVHLMGFMSVVQVLRQSRKGSGYNLLGSMSRGLPLPHTLSSMTQTPQILMLSPGSLFSTTNYERDLDATATGGSRHTSGLHQRIQVYPFGRLDLASDLFQIQTKEPSCFAAVDCHEPRA